jgi:hypothetical protein
MGIEWPLGRFAVPERIKTVIIAMAVFVLHSRCLFFLLVDNHAKTCVLLLFKSWFPLIEVKSISLLCCLHRETQKTGAESLSTSLLLWLY